MTAAVGGEPSSGTSVVITLLMQTQITAVVPTGVTPPQMALALQSELCDLLAPPICSVVAATASAGRRRRRLQEGISFSAQTVLEATSTAPIASPTVNATSLAMALGVPQASMSAVAIAPPVIEAQVSAVNLGDPTTAAASQAVAAMTNLGAALATSLSLPPTAITTISTPTIVTPPVAPPPPRVPIATGYSTYSYGYGDESPSVPPPALPQPPGLPPLTPARGILSAFPNSCSGGADALADDDFVRWDVASRSLLDGRNRTLPSFASVNVPNIGRIELPAEACAGGFACARTPTDFEIVDTLCSVQQMRGVVARTYVFSHGNGGGFHVRAPSGTLEETWFAVFDRVLALASELGVRLVVPFVNTAYYELWGSAAMYAIWVGRREDPNLFFASRPQIELFKAVITRILTRVNTLTGRAYAHEPAILAWELGNELTDPRSGPAGTKARPPASWTEEIAMHVKSLAPRHLVVDGGFFEPAALTLQAVDLVGSTYYNQPASDLGTDLDAVAAASAATPANAKGFVLKEFGLVSALVDNRVIVTAQNTTWLSHMFDLCANARGVCVGSLFWSLRPHAEEGGFHWHLEQGGDIVSLHW